MAPNTSDEFDRAYRAPITPWGDVRTPPELIALVERTSPQTSLELGCGIGRNTRYLAQHGVNATGIDWSPVAIAKARERAEGLSNATYQVGDVTKLDALTGPFDLSLDVGCFHCLDGTGQKAYASELARLLRPGATHLLWTLDVAPTDQLMTPELVKSVFAPLFTLADAKPSRRRLIRSHWFWLSRR